MRAHKRQSIQFINPINRREWWKTNGYHPNIRAQAMLDDPNYPRPVSMVSKAETVDQSIPRVMPTKARSWEVGGWR